MNWFLFTKTKPFSISLTSLIYITTLNNYSLYNYTTITNTLSIYIYSLLETNKKENKTNKKENKTKAKRNIKQKQKHFHF